MSKPFAPTPFKVGTLIYTPWIGQQTGGLGFTFFSTAAYIVSGESPYDCVMRDSRTDELFRMRGLHRFPVDSSSDPLDNPVVSLEAVHSHYLILDEIMGWLNENTTGEWGISHAGEGHALAWDFSEEVDAVLFKMRWY